MYFSQIFKKNSDLLGIKQEILDFSSKLPNASKDHKWVKGLV